MKKTIALFLAMLFIFALCPAVYAEDTGVVTLAVNPYGGSEDDIDSVRWFCAGGQYFLFLPADADPQALSVYFSASGDVTLDGAAIVSGGSAAAFTPGTHTLVCGGVTYPLQVMAGSALPAVFLTTKSGSLAYIESNKDNKEAGKIRIYENGAKTLDGELKQIKGRGNATWSYPKKPYNIKFDKKTSVLGMAKAKKWTLLASCKMDNALMKNAFALDFGRAAGLPETSEYRQADLYINGEYRGVYLICESVEAGENRVDINDLDKANEEANPDIEDLGAQPKKGVQTGYVPGSSKWVDIPVSPADISGGYLLEMDYLSRYHAEPSGFISNMGAPMVIGSPEYATEAEAAYISGLWNEAEAALYSPTGCNGNGKYYTDYFDLDSLVRCYIAEELTKDVDVGITSSYFYKKANDNKFYAGPLWDFDHAMGSHTNIGNGLTVYEPDTWYANQLHRNSIDTACHDFETFFARCYRFADFRAAVSQAWTEELGTTAGEACIPALEALRDKLTASAVMNHIRWNTYGTADPSEVRGCYLQDADALISFLTARKPMLDKGFAADGALVIYDGNGGTGAALYDAKIYSVGETAAARENISFSCEGRTFRGWNTAEDGSGQSVAPGERFTLTQQVNVLYAMWEDTSSAPETEPATGQPTEPQTGADKGGVWQRILAFFRKILDFFRQLFK
ncbi:MAG: CotH kinase family protein [Clostridia bacterium]|nr:CotH kinase family protein [Clostridia bacterium]